jgi:hypothetical protein
MTNETKHATMANMETTTRPTDEDEQRIPWPEDRPVLPLWPDVAEGVYGMSRPTAYSLAGKDKFPCEVFRVGSRWMVRTARLREALGLPLCRPELS